MSEPDPKRCQSINIALVQYADGELPAAQAAAVAEHLAACPQCRRTLAALEASIELARDVWTESARALEPIVVPRPARRMRIWPAAAASAACAAAAVGILLAAFWRHGGDAPAAPARSETKIVYTAESIERQISREVISAKLVALGEIIASRSDSSQSAAETFRYVVETYPETSAAKRVAKEILPY